MKKLIVIGNGMAGIRFVEEVLKKDKNQFDITMIGDEKYPGYNRIQLSEVLEGEMGYKDIIQSGSMV